ncbi:uridine phosphorylase [Thermogladius calderae 1633]|uniref:Uridine phosphorylase n=1 Tax=Thermogladius calderae (strain DSM 22663 / VKM B-2946 / 1633) TaxID=1184251 RepID=I3TEF6_THEC1|nr:uridine phosphorylase [Thermogladius calderae 1633]
MSAEGRVYHLAVKPGDVSRYVLLPGDPERVPRIAKYWEKHWLVASHREYVTYSGYYKGVFISATSTGIGGPATAIAVEELAQVGADTLIRVGTTGALTREVKVGDLIISTGAVRLDGTSRQYVIPEYPAVASFEVVLALIGAAEELGVRYHVGLTASSDSFYVGQERPGFRGYLPPFQRGLIEFLRSVRVLNFEMEAATIFTLSNIYGLRSGAVCAAIANRETEEFIVDAGVEDAIKVANEAVKILSEWDSIASSRRRVFVTPSLIGEWFEKRRKT